MGNLAVDPISISPEQSVTISIVVSNGRRLSGIGQHLGVGGSQARAISHSNVWHEVAAEPVGEEKPDLLVHQGAAERVEERQELPVRLDRVDRVVSRPWPPLNAFRRSCAGPPKSSVLG